MTARTRATDDSAQPPGRGTRRYVGRHRRRRSVPPGLLATSTFAVVAGGELLPVLDAAPAHAATSSDFARLRGCESGGNYRTDTGNGYYGAYQFDLATWHGLGYPGLPSDAPPSVQDEAARRLQAQRGWEPWPACSRMLGLRDGAGQPASLQSGRPAYQEPAQPAAHLTSRAAHRPVAAPASRAPAFGGTLLTVGLIGDVREDVRRWQAAMAHRGWHITVDGRYGPQSAAVCTAFERAMGLHVEDPGIVGPQVWRATFGAPSR